MARNSTERISGEYDPEPKEFDFFLYTESTQPFRASTSRSTNEGVGSVANLSPFW